MFVSWSCNCASKERLSYLNCCYDRQDIVILEWDDSYAPPLTTPCHSELGLFELEQLAVITFQLSKHPE